LRHCGETAINAKEVEIRFNKELQDGILTGGAKNLTYYSIDGVNPTRVT